MLDEKMIKSILVEAGVFSWALAQAGSEAELMRMFQDDFQALGEMQFIKPVWWREIESSVEVTCRKSMEDAKWYYQRLLDLGWRPEQAREVLPNSLKTEIVVTANLREWRHILTLRTSKAAHPQMRALMLDCLKGFQEVVPIIFDDIQGE